MGLIAWIVCYWLYPEALIEASRKAGSSHAVLSFKIISACCVSGILLISSMVIVFELMSGRALIEPFVEQKNVLEEEPYEPVLVKPVPPKHDEDSLMREEQSDLVTSQTMPDMQPALEKAESHYAVHVFARALHHLEVSRILAISSEGDNGAVVTLELVRELADRGSRVILVDMTGTGAVSSTMLDGHYEAGITDLLAGRVRFADAIYVDHYSEAHVMPLGSTDPAQAMQNEKDLSLIIGALETVYDLVVLECGPTGAEDIAALVTHKTQIALTVYDGEQGSIAQHAQDLNRNGYMSFIHLHASEAAVPSTR